MAEVVSRRLRDLVLDAAVVVAASVGFLYVVGVNAHRAYMGTLGVPTTFTLDADHYVAQGFNALANALILSALVAVAMVSWRATRPFVLNGVALLLLALAIMASVQTLVGARPLLAVGGAATAWRVTFWPLVVLVLAALAVGLVGRETLRRRPLMQAARAGFAVAGWSGAVAAALLALVFAVYVGSAAGQNDASAVFLSGQAPLVTVAFEPPGSDLHGTPLVLLLHYDGKLYLMHPPERLDPPPAVHVVPEDDVVSFTVIARSWHQPPPQAAASP